jgi:TolB protein
MNTETGASRRLFTDAQQIKFSNAMPVVSPKGKRVAFVSSRSGHYRIWVANLDGSDAKAISPLDRDEHPTLKLPLEQKVPAWSPDGKRIAHWQGVEMTHMSRFTGKRDRERDEQISQTWHVWTVGADGKNKRKMGRGDDPTWSPDGFVTRAFPDPKRGGPRIMIDSKAGWADLSILPSKTPRYGRFTWKP